MNANGSQAAYSITEDGLILEHPFLIVPSEAVDVLRQALEKDLLAEMVGAAGDKLEPTDQCSNTITFGEADE